MTEVLEHVGRFFRTDQPGRLVALIVRLKVLAEVGLGVAAAHLFDFRADVTKEVALDGLAQVAGRMLGHPFAGLGNGDQLLPYGSAFFSFAAISRASSA